MKIGDTTLIPQNVSLPSAKNVVICDKDDNIVFRCELGHLSMPDIGEKRYSVGLLSDTHTRDADYDSDSDEVIDDSQNDLAEALKYFATVADITCVCGDLGHYKEDLPMHKEIVDANKGDMLVLEIAGNHEHFTYPSGAESITTSDDMITYTGYPLQYIVERNGDVFIMCGAVRYSCVFNDASFNWLYETLEANRNKRCFLFVHAPIEGAQYCGDSTDVLTWDMLGTYKEPFTALLKHYKNVIYFHGHTHGRLQNQEYTQKLNQPLPANYDSANGIHSVHIPSLAVPRDISSGTRVDIVGESQGYLMDVYDNHIVLKGIDFANRKFIPIAQYCLDTTLQPIEAGTFTDSTGTVTT